MILLFALFASWTWTATAGASRWLLRVAGASSLVVALIWIYMAGAYYFTNVGAALDIRAATPSVARASP